MADRSGMMLYHDDFNIFRNVLSAEQIGFLVCALLDYSERGEDTNVPKELYIAYEMLKKKVDRDAAAFDKRSGGTSAENGKKGGRPPKTEEKKGEEKPNSKPNENLKKPNSKLGFEKPVTVTVPVDVPVNVPVPVAVAVAETETERTRDGTPAAATAPDVDPDLGEVYAAYQKCGIGTYSVHDRERVADLYAEYGKEWCAEAFSRAADAGKRTIAYAEGILRSWKAGGGMDERGSGKQRAAPDNPALNYTQRRDDLEGMYVDL